MSSAPVAKSLAMQIIVRRDLTEPPHDWLTGPLMAQAAHAATAVLHLHGESNAVRTYLADWTNMRKTVMQVKDEATMNSLSAALSGHSTPFAHHMWMEEPEHIPTALALVPNSRPKALVKILKEHGVDLWR